MFRHLLIPLDGSTLAEAVLPVAAAIASKAGARVTLLHVIEHHAPDQVHGQRHLTALDEAEKYLREVAARALPPGVPVAWHVHAEEVCDVAAGLAAHVSELAPDLIVMCAHVEGHTRDWLFGNLAQQVVERGGAPVLLVRPEAVSGAAFHRILIPLDGTPEHEGAVSPATDLARLFGAALQVLMVVPTVGTLAGPQAITGGLLPGTTRAVLELAEAEAAAYGARLADPLRGGGCEAAAVVRRGQPLSLIAQYAEAEHADLVAVATHGRRGTHAFWEGSMAQRLVRRLHPSFLLAPAPKEPGAPGNSAP
jgi:nucleotide-binding universal stress UspA family protein